MFGESTDVNNNNKQIEVLKEVQPAAKGTEPDVYTNLRYNQPTVWQDTKAVYSIVSKMNKDTVGKHSEWNRTNNVRTVRICHLTSFSHVYNLRE
jgi:hypothetical protein